LRVCLLFSTKLLFMEHSWNWNMQSKFPSLCLLYLQCLISFLFSPCFRFRFFLRLMLVFDGDCVEKKLELRGRWFKLCSRSWFWWRFLKEGFFVFRHIRCCWGLKMSWYFFFLKHNQIKIKIQSNLWPCVVCTLFSFKLSVC
jgi:hypothetical protein